MSSIAIKLLSTLALITMLGTTIVAQEKLGVTNVELILANMPESASIEMQLAEYEKLLTATVEAKQNIYESKVTEYYQMQEANQLTPELQQKYIEDITKLEQDIQIEVQSAEQKLLGRRAELLEPLQTKMQTAIDEVAAEKGLTYILNQTVGGGVPSIIYVKEGKEITVDIARKLGIQVE